MGYLLLQPNQEDLGYLTIFFEIGLFVIYLVQSGGLTRSLQRTRRERQGWQVERLECRVAELGR